MKKMGIECEIFTRFVKKQYPGNEFFSRSEREQVFDNDGVTTHVIGMSALEKLFLLPLKKLRWRKQTEPLAIAMVNMVFKRKFHKKLKGFDLIHYDGGGMELMSYAVRAVARDLNIPFCVLPSCHAGHWGHLPVDHRFFRSADAMLPRSEVEGDYLERVAGVGRDKIYCVGSGIDDVSKGNAAAFLKEYSIPEGVPIILFVGRLSRDKGYGLLREAFAIVKKQHAEVRLVCIGPDEDLEGVYPKDEARVVHTGFINGVMEADKLADAYASGSILCVPSEGESFGLIFLEAGLAGVPVVCRPLNVLEELVGKPKAGLLVGTRNPDGSADATPEQIAEGLITLLEDDTLRKRLGENGRVNAEKFLWHTVIHRFLKAYEDVYTRFHGTGN